MRQARVETVVLEPPAFGRGAGIEALRSVLPTVVLDGDAYECWRVASPGRTVAFLAPGREAMRFDRAAKRLRLVRAAGRPAWRVPGRLAERSGLDAAPGPLRLPIVRLSAWRRLQDARDRLDRALPRTVRAPTEPRSAYLSALQAGRQVPGFAPGELASWLQGRGL